MRDLLLRTLNYKQGPIKNRLILSLPLFVIAYGLTLIDFNIIWRYFAWANQTLAMVVLWAGSFMYMVLNEKSHWFVSIPATFMTAVAVTYILVAPEGFKIATSIAYPIGIVIAVASLVLFLTVSKRN